MSSAAKARMGALGKQLAPAGDITYEGVPPITQVAPASNGPRAQGKVVIITGMSLPGPFLFALLLLVARFRSTRPKLATRNTGANSPIGIGRATAHQFAQNGAKAVYLCDFDDKFLRYHEEQIKSLYPSCEVHTRKFDAADEPAVKAVVNDALKTYGRLDVMFANAGITGTHALFTDVTEEDFMQTLRVNTLG